METFFVTKVSIPFFCHLSKILMLTSVSYRAGGIVTKVYFQLPLSSN